LQKLLKLYQDNHESRLDCALILLDLKEYNLLKQERDILGKVERPSERLDRYLVAIDE
jgi:hypothetical protein